LRPVFPHAESPGIDLIVLDAALIHAWIAAIDRAF
jgi:hypothetical protein